MSVCVCVSLCTYVSVYKPDLIVVRKADGCQAFGGDGDGEEDGGGGGHVTQPLLNPTFTTPDTEAAGVLHAPQ